MKLSKTLMAASGALLVASGVFAQVVTVSQIDGYHATDGEFNISPIVGSGYNPLVVISNGFETFCISRDTGIAIPGSYFYSVSAAGIYLPQGLTISKGTAWLYSQFTAGTLAGYNYNGGLGGQPRIDSAYYLQLAVWTLEGQYWYGPGPGSLSLEEDLASNNPFLLTVAATFGGGTNGLAAAMGANAPSGYNVGVINMNTINPDSSVGGSVQPMLVLLTPVCVTPNGTITAPVSVISGSTNDTASVPDAGSGATYVWSILNGQITDGQGTPQLTFTAGTNGTTTVSIVITTAGNCTAGGSREILDTCTNPDATITAPISVTAGTTNTASIPNAGAGATYVWTISNGTVAGGQGTSQISWKAGTNGTTTLAVTVTVPGGCSDSKSKTVIVTCVAPNAAITAAISVSAGSSNNLASVPTGSAGTTYLWSIVNGTINSGQGTPQIHWTAGLGGTTTIGVSITTAGGCGASGCVRICLTNGYSTYTIGGWGAPPNGQNIASKLLFYFPTVYPKGVCVGNVGANYNIKLTSQPAIQNLLGGGGTPGYLKHNFTNPTSTEAGVFASQVIALKLNMDFSALGIKKPGLANLKVAPGNKLAGYTVTQVATLANKVLGGTTSALPVGVSLSDLNGVVDAINNNFDNGTSNNGFLVP
jgi:hypothetical protein